MDMWKKKMLSKATTKRNSTRLDYEKTSENTYKANEVELKWIGPYNPQGACYDYNPFIYNGWLHHNATKLESTLLYA